ncbi:RHS repeat-associated core domain-containing protein [Neptunitalea chrysea]|nr:RHS repeat-associated core domain-containing protein [Neptunitalea chrysea]
MTQDLNKGISNITYNHLNLPTELITNQGTITYIYDATGIKLKKIVTNTQNSSEVTEYCGAYIYSNDVLEYIAQPDGYIEPVFFGSSLVGVNYFYQYKDHLGNNRLTYTDAASLFIEDTFDSDTSDWSQNGSSVTLTNDAGRLKVELTNLNYTNKQFTIDPNLDVHISFDYDPGTMIGGPNGVMALREYRDTDGDGDMEWEPWGTWNSEWLPSEQQRITITAPASSLTSGTVMLMLQRNTGNSAAPNITYCFIDNLVITQNDVEIVEENNYYPFGLRHNGYNDIQAGTQGGKFKYQGQELEEEFNLNLYEFELRHYDSALGRFNTTDPYEQFDSPYLAMGNNPIIAIDPNGGNCVDINGNPIACPEDEFYDDYRDNDENQITVLEEVSASNSSGSWSSEGLKDVPATWESPFANMGEFNNYYGTNFGQGDNDAAMRWLQKQQRDVMVAQHMAEFYRGRSEMSMGVLKLMFTIVTSVQFAELGTLGYINASEYLAVRGSNYVNLASSSRTAHIISGDATGGGHAWFGSTKSFMNGLKVKKSMFPATWSNSKIMNGVSEVVTSNPWVQQTGRAGAMFTRSGQPVRFVTEGFYNGTKIRVINTHSEIITAFPIR